MESELVVAGAGLIGAFIGALASVGGVVIVERNRARQLRRDRYLAIFIEGVMGGDRKKAVESKVWLAVLGSRDRIREWGAAQTSQEISGALTGMLLDVVNGERAAHCLDRLNVTELGALIPIGDAQ